MEKCLIERRDGEACNREGGWRSVLKKVFNRERGDGEVFNRKRRDGEVFNREGGDGLA